MKTLNPYKHCSLCPRDCGIDRTLRTRLGYCGETDQVRVAYVGPHYGEEPPITGKRGSGTVFFTGCPLRCSYCQNFQISHRGVGFSLVRDTLALKVEQMIEVFQVHNLNFVTPDHFFPHVFDLVHRLRVKGYNTPVIYNLSGYQAIDALRSAKTYVDIYLPDFKYADPTLAWALSRCRDYTSVALDGMAEMVRQKGFLCLGEDELAKCGVLVRHLILPGHIQNSIDALTSLFLEFGSELPLSLMSQYYPVLPQRHEGLNRCLTSEEFNRVYSHAVELGFERVFVQFPEPALEKKSTKPFFVPDFLKGKPFG